MTRRSVVVHRFGDPDVLRIDVGEAPRPVPGELRLRVLAAGVAPADVHMRAGRYTGPAPSLPFVPGWDVTGVVDAVGAGTSRNWLGRRVVALVLRGGHTSHLCLPETAVVPLPDGVDVYEAACLPLNYVTAHELVHQVARVRPRERVLVRGAAGGLGTALLDVAGRTGARTIGSASGDDRSIVTSYGADFVDHAENGAPEVAGYDVVFDPTGATTSDWYSAVTRGGGRVVSYGFLAAARDRNPRRSAARSLVRLRLRSLLPDGRRVMFYRLSTTAQRNPTRLHRTLTTLIEELSAGHLRPLSGPRLPLDHAAEAHRLVEGRTRGKILLLP